MSYDERRIFEEYVNLVEKCMNHESDPCDDFIEFASGNFREQDFDMKKGEYPPSFYGYDYILKIIFMNERITNPTLEKARDLCRSKRGCLGGGLKEFLRSDQFNEFCGGLPAFNDNWSAENFIWARAVGILSALQYNTILTLNMEFFDDAKVIFVNIQGFPAYRLSEMEDILKTLDLDDKRLAQIINDLNFFKEVYPERFAEEYFRRSGLELQDDMHIFDFKEFIETALSVTIHDDDIIHLEDGVMHFVSFLSRLDRRVLANYLTVMATDEYFDDSSEGICDEVLINIFRPILVSTAFKTYYNEIEEKKYKYVVERFNQSFKAVESDYPEDIRETEETAFRENFDQVVEYISKHYNLSKVCKEYENLQISPDNFYQNLINIKNHGIPESLKRFDSLRGVTQDMNRSVTNFLDYITTHWNKPMVFYFAGQETCFWKYVIGARNHHFNNVTDNERDRLVEILESLVEHFPKLNNEHELQEFAADSIISSIEAIENAYRDYKTWMRENETTVRWQNEILSRINLDCHKLFFVAFVQHLVCYAYSEKKTAIMTLVNFQDFCKVFKCNPESRMNPRKFLL